MPSHYNLFVTFILLCCFYTGLVSSLTTEDFYFDPNAPVIETLNGSTSGVWHNLSISIQNIRTAADVPIEQIQQSKGYFRIQDKNNKKLLDTNILFPSNPFKHPLVNGEATLQFSTDSDLLVRARNDLKAYGCVAAPTHLIIMNNINISVSTSTDATTYQAVIATNGRYTYLIIQFVSVEAAAVARQDLAYLYDASVLINNFPYSSNKANAPKLTNVGVPGKYIINYNATPPPPFSCQKQMLKLTCKWLMMKNERVPNVCNTAN